MRKRWLVFLARKAKLLKMYLMTADDTEDWQTEGDGERFSDKTSRRWLHVFFFFNQNSKRVQKKCIFYGTIKKYQV
jgi:hypothetical protein